MRKAVLILENSYSCKFWMVATKLPIFLIDKQILMGRIFGLRKVVVNISNMLV